MCWPLACCWLRIRLQQQLLLAGDLAGAVGASAAAVDVACLAACDGAGPVNPCLRLQLPLLPLHDLMWRCYLEQGHHQMLLHLHCCCHSHLLLLEAGRLQPLSHLQYVRCRM